MKKYVFKKYKFNDSTFIVPASIFTHIKNIHDKIIYEHNYRIFILLLMFESFTSLEDNTPLVVNFNQWYRIYHEKIGNEI